MTLFRRPRWHRQTRVPLGEDAARPHRVGDRVMLADYGTGTVVTVFDGSDRIPPAVAVTADIGGVWFRKPEDVPLLPEAGVAAFVTEEARGWRHPKGNGWHRA